MADNFDLKKFLKENKALENLNPSLKSLNERSCDNDMKAKIKEMVIAELGGEIDDDPDAKLNTDYDPVYEGEGVEEAEKKDKGEEVDIEVTDAEEEIPAEDEIPAEETSEATGGIEDIAADMKGTEADLMDHLMKAFQISKGMQNEKLETQIGNTLKFFVSEYIGGGE